MNRPIQQTFDEEDSRPLSDDVSDPVDDVLVAAMYRFTSLPNFRELQKPLQAELRRLDIRGTLLLAAEGINGTIAGPPDSLRQMVHTIREWEIDGRQPFGELDVKWSSCPSVPFRRARVRLKREIVTMGVPDLDPTCVVGTYVDPEDWNDVVDDPETLLIDTRNDYEVAIGTFAGAVSPETESFREFPQFVEKKLDPRRHRRVAMFCTGGIRCEKSTAYLKECGFEDVLHLRGGILNYLERIRPEDSRWQGECFVFDERVSVGHDLQVGRHSLCHGCGWPIDEQMKQSPKYEPGVACPRCDAEVTEDQRRRRRMRQQQWERQRAAASVPGVEASAQ